ncbi:hypothetical protein [Clostridium sp. MCC353]|uniref:hypothetical protein n=1 Tax=Clostridium sp. MCC353 TaxID=2592646 RepID=UPI0031FE748D
MLQELIEAELNASLGYEKNQKGNITTDNKRNAYSSKNSQKPIWGVLGDCSQGSQQGV